MRCSSMMTSKTALLWTRSRRRRAVCVYVRVCLPAARSQGCSNLAPVGADERTLGEQTSRALARRLCLRQQERSSGPIDRMSAREPPGTATRQDLFVPSARGSARSGQGPFGDGAAAFPSASEEKQQQFGDDSKQGVEGNEHKAGAEAKATHTPVAANELVDVSAEVRPDQPLELEHVVGYTGHHLHTIQCHPSQADLFVRSAGAIVLSGDLGDPHAQKLLRGHDMEVSAVELSLSGALIASGQVGSKHHRSRAAPVIIWDAETGERRLTLTGISEGVVCLAFSPDDRFLCGSGQDNLLYIWDTATGEVAFGRRYPHPITAVRWGAITEQARRNAYRIVLAEEGGVDWCEFCFDPVRVQWQLHPTRMSTPAGGNLSRQVACVSITHDGKYCFTGTNVGDMIVYGTEAAVYRAAIPVCSGGLRAIVILPNTDPVEVLCGGGDGVVRKVIGGDMRWEEDKTTSLDGAIASMSLAADGAEVLVGTTHGMTYRVLTDTLDATLVETSHTAPATCVSFGSRNDIFATGSSNGTIKVWDLSDYMAVAEVTETRGGRVQALCWHEPEGDGAVKGIVSGWEDNFIRCHDAETLNRTLWYIANAHSGGVTAVAVRDDTKARYVLSGGQDGSVRVWSLVSRELMLQFTEHRKRVQSVVTDIVSSSVVHSVSTDCSILSYDLERERRTVAHLVRDGPFQCMAQRPDGEQELITCDSYGRIMLWDCDYADAVQCMSDPSRCQLNALAVSSTGRYIAFCGEDGLIKVLDLSSADGDAGHIVAIGEGHSDNINALCWSPDDRQILSVGDDCCVCVWNWFGDQG